MLSSISPESSRTPTASAQLDRIELAPHLPPRTPARAWWRRDQLNRNLKKLLRTTQVQFPALLDAKFAVTRGFRNALQIPFENDFRALALFPDFDGALFLDVGANRGQSTDAILMQRKNARIELFEPNPLLVGKLRRMFGRREHIAIHDFGLSDQAAVEKLVVPSYGGWMFDGLASFNRTEAADWLKPRMFFYDDRRLSLQEVPCQLRRLDDLHLAPFFVKLDIQGYEYKALRGAERTIREHRPIFLIESPNEETVGFLKDFGYGYYTFSRGMFTPGVIGTPNTFFLSREIARWVRSYIRTSGS